MTTNLKWTNVYFAISTLFTCPYYIHYRNIHTFVVFQLLDNLFVWLTSYFSDCSCCSAACTYEYVWQEIALITHTPRCLGTSISQGFGPALLLAECFAPPFFIACLLEYVALVLRTVKFAGKFSYRCRCWVLCVCHSATPFMLYTFYNLQ